ncbi:MAG: ATP synthase F0 subunit B [Bacteroidetes bacterium HGW-Bacteroidetes-15]|nr:MAG: ATP synthase F0 subunit B [Bacteroidetes bacterium HGW-Bacteroidetes-15]
MGIITPDYGLLFWMLLSFSILLFILKKFAWKPILHGIKAREELIAKSLRDAEYARNEVAKLEERNAELLAKAHAQRDAVLAQAKIEKDKILEDAQQKAKVQTHKTIEQANETIRREKEAAQLELRAYATQIIIQATERILRKELKETKESEEQINSIIRELTSKN